LILGIIGKMLESKLYNLDSNVGHPTIMFCTEVKIKKAKMQFTRFFIALLVIGFICADVNEVFAASKSKKNAFREGIKTHDDWIERFKETHDYRIFKLLANRAGRIADVALSKKVSAQLKQQPDQIDTTFKRWGIILDHQVLEEKAIDDWVKKYGKQALVIPKSKSTRKKMRYLTLSTKGDEYYAKMIAYYMEKVHSLYHDKFKTKEKIEGKFIIKLYPNRKDFASTGGPKFAFAYFRGSTRELVGYVPKDKGWDKKFITDSLIHVFFHEGFHQFLSYYVPDAPTWLDEGFANMFQAIQVRGSKLYEGKLVNYGDLMRMKENVKSGRYTPLKDLIFYTQKQYYNNTELHYPQGWSVVHFLAYGSPTYRKFFMGVITNLKNGMDREEALKDVFAKVNWDKMELAWKSYIKKTKNVKPVNTYK
jgi:hypothetical protein